MFSIFYSKKGVIIGYNVIEFNLKKSDQKCDRESATYENFKMASTRISNGDIQNLIKMTLCSIVILSVSSLKVYLEINDSKYLKHVFNYAGLVL